MNNTKLLVVIVTYNAMQWAKKCFNSILNSDLVPTVFIVDNGSTDGTQRYISENYPQFIFSQSVSNLGFARANNIGFHYALQNCFEYVYLLNQDAWVMPDTFSKLITVMKTYPDFGIISPIQMNGRMSAQDRNFNEQYINRKQVTSTFSEVDSIMAAHWMMSIDCIKKVGVFSPAFYHYREDDNYIDRLHYHGLKCGILDTAKAVHDREFRTDSVAKLADLHYKGRILVISDPLDNPIRCMLTQPIRLLSKIGDYGIITTLFNVAKLVFQYPKLLYYRRQSMKEGAFINK